MSNDRYAPGTFVKGDREKVALRRRDAVALVFEGYVRKADPAPVSEPLVDDIPKPKAPKRREATENQEG